MTFHSVYKGAHIYRNTSPGYSLRWLAATDCGGMAADTLAGIRMLIRTGK